MLSVPYSPPSPAPTSQPNSYITLCLSFHVILRSHCVSSRSFAGSDLQTVLEVLPQLTCVSSACPTLIRADDGVWPAACGGRADEHLFWSAGSGCSPCLLVWSAAPPRAARELSDNWPDITETVAFRMGVFCFDIKWMCYFCTTVNYSICFFSAFCNKVENVRRMKTLNYRACFLSIGLQIYDLSEF